MSSSRSVVAIALALMLTAALLSGFDVIGRNWRYQADPMGEDFRICAAGMPSEAPARIQDGAAAWKSGDFEFSFGTNACLAGGRSSKYDSINQVNFGPLGSQTLARMVLWYNPADLNILECDLMFNSKVQWYAGTSKVPAGRDDFWSVAAHEMGHCLGLGHSDDVTAVMFQTLDSGTKKRTLRADDEDGRDSIYP